VVASLLFVLALAGHSFSFRSETFFIFSVVFGRINSHQLQYLKINEEERKKETPIDRSEEEERKIAKKYASSSRLGVLSREQCS